MNLLDIVKRQPIPEPWAEGEKIPWDDPDFSARMLKEHLSQDHHRASRRTPLIKRHVEWIDRYILEEHPTRILELACGPGLYTSRLARLGHQCVGIDFSPASIEYAIQQATAENLRCTYMQRDIRTADYGSGYGLVMLTFGEFNTFRTGDAVCILQKAYAALTKRGWLILEPHTYEAVRGTGTHRQSWYAVNSGLFCAEPHICLYESFWNAAAAAVTERYYIIKVATGEVDAYASSMQAYTEVQYQTLLTQCGFTDVRFYPSLSGAYDESQQDLLCVVARKA